MIETILEIKEVRKNKICSIRCNRCGEDMITDCSPMGNGINVKFEAGYDSSVFGDGAIVSFDLCEGCIKDISDDFSIPPKIDNRYSCGDE